MTDDLVLYTNPMSRGRIVRWMLEEVGAPYRTEIMAYDVLKAQSYLALNPMGKVPTLTHGTTVVTECAAICAYLADAFPAAGLAPPADSPLRGPYYRWLFFGAGPVESAVTNKALGVVVPEGRERMAGYGSFETTMGTLEAAVSGTEYLAGDRFTAADLYIASQLSFGMRFGIIERRPAFEAYAGRMAARPAAVRAGEIDDALIPAPAGG